MTPVRRRRQRRERSDGREGGNVLREGVFRRTGSVIERSHGARDGVGGSRDFGVGKARFGIREDDETLEVDSPEQTNRMSSEDDSQPERASRSARRDGDEVLEERCEDGEKNGALREGEGSKGQARPGGDNPAEATNGAGVDDEDGIDRPNKASQLPYRGRATQPGARGAAAVLGAALRPRSLSREPRRRGSYGDSPFRQRLLSSAPLLPRTSGMPRSTVDWYWGETKVEGRRASIPGARGSGSGGVRGGRSERTGMKEPVRRPPSHDGEICKNT